VSDYADTQIELVMHNLGCTEVEAVEALRDATSLREKLLVMGLATEQGGDITPNPNWRDEL
jgi:hypothetical protein